LRQMPLLALLVKLLLQRVSEFAGPRDGYDN
jgi:hypothetical protein